MKIENFFKSSILPGLQGKSSTTALPGCLTKRAKKNFELKYSTFSCLPEFKVEDFFKKGDDGFYHCIICGFADKNSGHMRTHTESKHFSPGYSCDLCGNVYKIKVSMNIHRRRCALTPEQQAAYKNQKKLNRIKKVVN